MKIRKRKRFSGYGGKRFLFRRGLALWLAAACLLSGFSVQRIQVFAENEAAPQTAVVVGSNLVRVRADAGATNDIPVITQLVRYYPVTILGEKTAANGILWYRIGFTLEGKYQEGYMHSTYLMKTTELPEVEQVEEVFETEISAFPESYKKKLRSLHVLFPNWQFEAVETGISWEEVLREEYVLKRNLVPDSSAFSWKSVRDGDYDWEVNKWISHDADWVGASREAIAYYLDPRNFMTADCRILQFEALNYVEGVQTRIGLENILKNSFMARDEAYYEYFLEAARTSQVSPYLLAARCLQEVGIDGSSTTSGTYAGYEGYYNFFNIGASANADGTGAVENALKYAKEKGWDSPQKAILGGAAFLGANYINKGQNTLYFQKFNVVNEEALFTHQYMQNLSAASTEAASLQKIYGDWENSAIAFRIPVYENMPEEAAPLPTGLTNDYRSLSSLKINNKDLEGFSPEQTNYEITIPGTTVRLSGVCPMQGTVVVCPEVTYLSPGTYQKEIVVQAVDGSTRSYCLTIHATASEKGDCDGDGKITVGDALGILMLLAGRVQLEGTDCSVLDTDFNNKVTVNDALRILMLLAGKIDNFS